MYKTDIFGLVLSYTSLKEYLVNYKVSKERIKELFNQEKISTRNIWYKKPNKHKRNNKIQRSKLLIQQKTSPKKHKLRNKRKPKHSTSRKKWKQVKAQYLIY